MQNLPSGSTFGKLIKACFIAPKGKLFLASDYAALEDVVNTLLTRDPNKEKVLIDKYDSHSFRAYHYWPKKFPNITLDVTSINSIKDLYDSIRSDSKPVSFALQYQGTWVTLVNNCGFSDDEAKAIEDNFLKLYSVSVDWVKTRLAEASKQGYAVGAFGLRIRTPVLSQVVIGNKYTPREAQAEGRTLGNAISGQSYGLLNTRASMEFMRRVRASKYKYDIALIAHIHDAIYTRVTDNFEVVAWVNKNLIECMAWQDLPELQHDQIKLSSELDIQYPTWKDVITLPNGANAEEIKQICLQECNKRNESSNEV